MTKLETLVDSYVECWRPHRLTYSGLYADNDEGCEHLQILRNGFTIESFSHNELCQLATLLIRELRGQINRDHKFFWAWCTFLTIQFRENVSVFNDLTWQRSFADLVNLLLASRRMPFTGEPVEAMFLQARYLREASRYVNRHMLETDLNKWHIAGPLAFSILEGLLRRKSEHYINTDGSVRRPFSISYPRGRPKKFDPRGRKSQQWVNRLNHLFRCFEQHAISHRGRGCPYLQQAKAEIATLYPSAADVYDTLDMWRNELMHGREYWQNRVPILANLICLLLIDEIDPTLYDAQRMNLVRTLTFRSRISGEAGASWFMYPPDL